jgi:26S proteasome regulatory subunit N10
MLGCVLYHGRHSTWLRGTLSCVWKPSCPCYVDVAAFGESDDEKPEKLETLVAAVHSGGNSHIVHIPAGDVLSDVIFSSPVFSEDRGSDYDAAASGASGFEFRVPQNNYAAFSLVEFHVPM